MNLFEQYGIKEVADVTLYAIALDKYDNEVYIPIIYFDTLKVSTVDQAAEQATARGGFGNPSLIVWDYGKEITVNLEDALYTPASQSLMWGGKFNLGKFKIYGAWYPRKIEDIEIEVKKSSDEENKKDFLNYKDLEISYCDFKTNLGYKEEYVTPIIPEEEEEERDYFLMRDFKKTGKKVYPECAELIIDSFEKVRTGSVNGKKYYRWIKPVLKLVSYENNQNLNMFQVLNVTVYENELNRYIIKINTDKNKLEFYRNYKVKTVDNNLYENYRIVNVPIGTFYVVQDRNYNNFNLSDTIYPIDYGIKNATVFDRIEKCIAKRDFAINFDQNLYSYNCSQLQQYKNKSLSYFINPMTMKPFECNCQEFTKSDGTKVYGDLVLIRKNQIYYKWTRNVAQLHQSLGQQIIIDTKHYPGCFRLVGETRARRRQDGVDERFQFEIPLCKLNSSNSFAFAAEGEPTTYNMSFKALRNSEGVLMKLTQYEVKEECKDNYSHIVPYNTYIPESEECCDKDAMASPSEDGIFMLDPSVKNCYKDWLPHRGCHYVPSRELVNITILNPPKDTVFTIDKDFGNPYNGEEPPYLKLPETQKKAEEYWNFIQEKVQIDDYHDEHRDILIIQAHYNDGSDEFLTDHDYDNITFNFEEIRTGDGQ